MRTQSNILTFSLNPVMHKNFRCGNIFHSIFKICAGIVFFSFAVILPATVFGQAAASSNYDTQTGTLGTTYNWINCSSGSNIVSGDDAQASIAWPFNFTFYDNTYTPANSLSIATNGFIRLDGTATTDYNEAISYALTGTATNLGQIIAMAVYDGKVGDNKGWIRSLVTGTAPNRIFTIEYNNLEIDYNDKKYADVQVSFYETSYKVVLKLGTENIFVGGVDMGIHSGVVNYFNKWQEVLGGTNNTWIEYIPTPTLTVNPTLLTGYSYCLGSGPSTSQSFTISGSNLTGSDITVTGSTNYTVSTDNTNFYTSVTYPFSGGIITGQPKTVYVRLKAGLSANNYNNENITFSGGGLSSPPTVSNSGTVNPIPATPTAENNGPLCIGNTLLFTVSTISGATYSWTGPNGFSSSLQNPSLSYTSACAGEYTVQVTTGGCSAIAYTNVISNPNPGQWTGNISTDWAFGDNWCSGTVPTSSTNVIVNSTAIRMPSIISNVACNDLTINAGATLTISATGTLNIAGILTNNSTIINDGTVNFNGTSGQQTFSGVSSFYNVTLSNTSGLFLPASIIVNNNLLITAGTLNASNFNIGLKGNWTNNVSTTAFIAGTATVTFNGSVAQSIGGIFATTFYNLTIDNTPGVTLTSNALTTVSGDLTINSGKRFEVEPESQLAIAGTLINNAGVSGFVLKSDATGTASLIHNTYNVPGTIQRYISGAAEAWHFLASPVAGQAISGSWLPSGTYGNGTGYDLYVWDEPALCWVYQLNTTVVPHWPAVHPSANFVPGRGYLYSVQAVNTTKAFAGNLNYGTVSYGLTAGGSTDLNLQGFNLVGNPYPSSIDWMAASGWTRANLMTNSGGNDMWIWNPDAGNYGVYNSADASGVGTNAVTRYIPSMQGFFVRAETAGNLETTNDVRVHDATTLWKSARLEPNRFIAVVNSETDQTFDEVRLLFGYPKNKAGAAKLFSPVATAPSLYLPEGKANFTIRYLSDTIANPHVPVLFKAGRDGFYSIHFDFDTFNFEVAILEDHLTGEFTDLTLKPDYRFSALQGDNENRFIIHFGATPQNANPELPANIFTIDGKLVIDLTLVDKRTEVKVVDVLGRTIVQKEMNGNSIHRLDVNVRSQIVIVYAKTNKAMLSRKVFVL